MKRFARIAVLAAVASVSAAATPDAVVTPAADSVASRTQPARRADNPFFRPSPLAFELPPFDRLADADFEPAFQAGMREQRREVDAIANATSAPTFDNTIVAMERSGQLLTRVLKVFFNLNASNGDETMRKLESRLAPQLSAHDDSPSGHQAASRVSRSGGGFEITRAPGSGARSWNFSNGVRTLNR